MLENRVRERRHELGMTLEDLARESKLPVSTISEVERGREPRIRTGQQIAWALDVDIDYLWPPDKKV